MSDKRHSDASLRELLQQFDNPMAVLKGPILWRANDGFLDAVCLPREQVEGQAFLDFMPREERSRIAGMYERCLAEGVSAADPSGTFTVRTPDGRHLELLLRAKPIALESGEPALLVNMLLLRTRTPDVGLSEQLVETSAALVTAHTEDAVRQTARDGLAATGLCARFFRFDAGTLKSNDGGKSPEDLPLGLEALQEGRPVFGGISFESATHVYLPLSSGLPEVLCVEGPGLRPLHSSALALFAKVVSAALTDSRLLSDLERRKWEMEAVAEVARFVAQPVPPTPDAFLARIAGPLSADAVVLHMPLASGEFVLAADFGLEEGLRQRFSGASDRVGLASVAATAEGGVLSGDTWEPTLRSSTEGRFACGVAVRLARGGHVRGTLQAIRGAGRPFGPGDLRLLTTFADLLVTLLEQRRLRAESARQLSETRLLLDLARTTAGTLEMSSILEVAADFLTKLLDVSNCFILLYEERAGELRCAATSAAHRHEIDNIRVPMNHHGVAARTARERRSVAVEDVDARPDQVFLEMTRRFHEKAVLGVPITARDELIGVIILSDSRRPRTFSAALIELAEATCGQLALSIENARLYESLWASYAELAATRAEMVKRERLAALGELSAIVAHEVRNPLGVIFNAVSSLRRLVPPGDAAMLLDMLGEESDRLNRIVGDLLDFTRPREPVLQPEDFARVLQDSLEAARAQQPSPGGREVTLSADVEQDLPPVPMDRRLIRQALVNVAVNAMQAMPQGGVVKVRARREERGKHELLRIDVSDDGPGIPAELVARVFEPFFTTKAQGTGLGLAVVKRILDEHRGEIAVESAPGRGTTFTFRLPLNRAVSLP